eukprot:CAMPEP_0197661924 /NCGR_PEP_ID=MMETSP1338-20131121/51753_1 /TAXON_ID=43686 ORGANISM="Pelagodinium beii, Strain RCC1491" /NCGR_SAMPLE_ID=MMETSP1338 /ASSEMBLY_ACC=CAM_ASM_000754 /LENGTH=107 /DNA_ID=CAMNT_0043239575 /DNA_START=80 /DNA_END=401 /DNA_ORIENTATION=+
MVRADQQQHEIDIKVLDASLYSVRLRRPCPAMTCCPKVDGTVLTRLQSHCLTSSAVQDITQDTRTGLGSGWICLVPSFEEADGAHPSNFEGVGCQVSSSTQSIRCSS